MILDLPTLAIFTILLTASGSLLLAFSWLQNRSEPALGWWAISFAGLAVALLLIASRTHMSQGISVTLGNAMLAAFYGMLWNAVRVFGGRRKSLWAAAGVVVWIAACNVPSFYQSVDARVILLSAIMSAFAVLTAFEIWRTPGQLTAVRATVVALCGVHAVTFVLRYSLAGALPFTGTYTATQAGWFIVITLETLFFAFALPCTLVALAKERIEDTQKRAAQIDALTGALNRGAFTDRAERILHRMREHGGEASLLLFDFDHFKEINDKYGHRAGDRMLTAFAELVAEKIRPTDFFGRMGGDEFAMLLDTSLDNAVRVAERIRKDMAARRLDVGNTAISTTVSVGAAHNASAPVFTDLYEMADAALYRAKAMGRDSVAWDEAPTEAPTSGAGSTNITRLQTATDFVQACSARMESTPPLRANATQ